MEATILVAAPILTMWLSHRHSERRDRFRLQHELRVRRIDLAAATNERLHADRVAAYGAFADAFGRYRVAWGEHCRITRHQSIHDATTASTAAHWDNPDW